MTNVTRYPLGLGVQLGLAPWRSVPSCGVQGRVKQEVISVIAVGLGSESR